MGWFSNLFAKKQNNNQTVSTKPQHTIKEEKPKVNVSYGGTLKPAEIVLSKYPRYYKNVHVILDNGHGEDTPGKRSPDEKLLEYKYAREIVSKISKKLDILGIPYTVLVPETKDIKLAERVKRANKIHQQQHELGKLTILLSIHCNAAGNGEWMKARGWSAWTSKGSTESDIISNYLYEAAHEILDPKKIKIREDMSDGDPDWESNFYIIYKSSMPAVLTENFFQDNKEDVKYLLSDEGKQDIVNIHIEGIKKYLDYKFKQ